MTSDRNLPRELIDSMFRDSLFHDNHSSEMFKMIMEEGETEGEGSTRRPFTKKYIKRERKEAHDRLFGDYFSDTPLYDEYMFRRRFRMSRALFNRIVDALSNHSEYFQMRKDAFGKRGLSPLQKCTAAIRQLAYGGPADAQDEYIKIGESTALECLNNFCRGVIDIFGDEYLRRPNAADVQRLIEWHKTKHGFPGMLGSIDCMHWAWKNCPNAWRGQYTRGDHGYPTIILEAVASQDLWIWHAYFGVAGSNNDINVLNQSTLFVQVLRGQFPPVQFMVNGHQYTQGYYLADGIYPKWATIVKSYPHPADDMRKKYKQAHEAARKDVERAFGVLQSRWAIIRGPGRLWDKKKLSDIMYACIILHNMIVENEGRVLMLETLQQWRHENGEGSIGVNVGPPPNFQEYMDRSASIRDKKIHLTLQKDLVEHIWTRNIVPDVENDDD